MNLQRKILYPILALFTAVMVVASCITYTIARKDSREVVTGQMNVIVKAKAELLELWIADGKNYIEAMAALDRVKALLKEDSDAIRGPLNTELAFYSKKFTGLSYINVVNAQGDTRASAVTDAVGRVKVADRPYFKQAMAGETFVSDVYVSRTTGLPVVTIATPVRDGGKVIGIVSGVMNLTALMEKFVDPVRVLQTGYLYIIDSTGTVIAHKDKSHVMKTSLKDFDWGRDLLQRKEGSIVYTYGGAERISVFAPCKGSGWIAAVIAPSSEVFENSNRLALVILVVFILGLGAMAVATIFITRSIAGPMRTISSGLDEAADRVASASVEVSSASMQLAEGATQQAASLEETSSSLEEMSSMTKQNAENSAQAKALMTDALKIVEKVNGQMNTMASSIEEVTRSSEEAGKIVRTIDEIAFQTNLLALNAAVEAARAGEAGAGFAVVADEVRGLAMRAAEAAKNSSGLIENTIAMVHKSRETTLQTQESFRENVEISRKVGNLVDEIAEASREQADGIGQISKAVTQMDKVVQQAAASSEESASAAEELKAQAGQMKGYVTDLIRVIGVAGDGQGRSAAHYTASDVPSLEKSVKTHPKPKGAKTVRPAAKMGGAGTMTKQRAEKLIPMDGHEFHDF